MPEALSRFQVCFEAIHRIQRPVDDGFLQHVVGATHFISQEENGERMILPARSVDHPFIRRRPLSVPDRELTHEQNRCAGRLLQPPLPSLSLSLRLCCLVLSVGSQGRGDQSFPGPGHLGSRPAACRATSPSISISGRPLPRPPPRCPGPVPDAGVVAMDRGRRLGDVGSALALSLRLFDRVRGCGRSPGAAVSAAEGW